jgi:hypothetical protein
MHLPKLTPSIVRSSISRTAGVTNSVQAAVLLVIDGIPAGQITGIDSIEGTIYYDPFDGSFLGGGGGLGSDEPFRRGCCQWQCRGLSAIPTARGICVYCSDYECLRPCRGFGLPQPPRVANPADCRRGGPCYGERDRSGRPICP